MEDKSNSCSKSSNGFLFGMIVGGALVFLIGTKKGRMILKQISEKGANTIKELSNLEDLESFGESEASGGMYEEAVKPKAEKEKPEVKSGSSNNGHTFGKRFFRGAKRK